MERHDANQGGSYLTGPVADITGLEGAWDFTVNYTPQNLFNQATGRGSDAGNTAS